MTPAVRPRYAARGWNPIIRICYRCQMRYAPGNFMSGTPHDRGNYWDWNNWVAGMPIWW